MRLLIYEPSYRRLEAEIAALGPARRAAADERRRRVTLRRPAGRRRRSRGAEAAWANADVFFGPVARAFMVRAAEVAGPEVGAERRGRLRQPALRPDRRRRARG